MSAVVGRSSSIQSVPPTIWPDDILPEQVAAVESSKKYSEWYNVMIMQHKHNNIHIDSITVRNIYWFGPPSKCIVGFVFVDVNAYDPNRIVDGTDATHPKLAGACFIRGHSVATLVFLRDPNTKYTRILAVEQWRTPGAGVYTEACAGMMDEDGNFKCVALKEVAEELNLKLDSDSVHELGTIAPSIGGCDEHVVLFYTEMEMSESQIKKLEGTFGGDGNAEHTHLILIPATYAAVKTTCDPKLIAAYSMWEHRND